MSGRLPGDLCKAGHRLVSFQPLRTRRSVRFPPQIKANEREDLCWNRSRRGVVTCACKNASRERVSGRKGRVIRLSNRNICNSSIPELATTKCCCNYTVQFLKFFQLKDFLRINFQLATFMKISPIVRASFHFERDLPDGYQKTLKNARDTSNTFS